MTRVLVVSFGVVPGPDRHAVQLAHLVKALAGRFSVDVLTLRGDGLAYVERYFKTRMLRVPVPDGPMAPKVDAFRRAVRRQVEGAEYDIVHLRDAWGGVPIVERKRALGFKTIFDLGRSSFGGTQPGDEKMAAGLRRDEEVCLAQADLVVAPSEAARSFLANRGVTSTAIIPPGVDIDRFDLELVEPANPPRVVYVGTIAPGHGVRVLLAAMVEVVARRAARLELVGPVDARFAEELGRDILRLGLEGHVELHGAVDNEHVPRVLSRGAVCVVPAAADLGLHPASTSPTKMLEYAACGRAIVAPRSASVIDVLEEGSECWLFEPGRARDLADGILALLGDAELRRRLGAAAQAKVRTRFSASGARRRVLEAYATLTPPSEWQPFGEKPATPPVVVDAALDARGATGSTEYALLASDTNPGVAEEMLAGPPTSPAAMRLETAELVDAGEPTPAAAPMVAHDTDGDRRAPSTAAGAGDREARSVAGVLDVEGAVAPMPAPVDDGDAPVIDLDGDLDEVLIEEQFAAMGSLLGQAPLDARPTGAGRTRSLPPPLRVAAADKPGLAPAAFVLDAGAVAEVTAEPGAVAEVTAEPDAVAEVIAEPGEVAEVTAESGAKADVASGAARAAATGAATEAQLPAATGVVAEVAGGAVAELTVEAETAALLVAGSEPGGPRQAR